MNCEGCNDTGTLANDATCACTVGACQRCGRFVGDEPSECPVTGGASCESLASEQERVLLGVSGENDS